jgi:hypothetical protein
MNSQPWGFLKECSSCDVDEDEFCGKERSTAW